MWDAPIGLACVERNSDAPLDPKPAASCVLCRHWSPVANRWGHCLSTQIRACLEVDGYLMTRDDFMCRFFSQIPSAMTGDNEGER